jgi:hypothetical protein
VCRLVPARAAAPPLQRSRRSAAAAAREQAPPPRPADRLPRTPCAQPAKPANPAPPRPPPPHDAQAAFQGRIVLFSNSAGLQQYDPDGAEAAQLEAQFGLRVLRHAEKKPAGGCAEAEAQLGCSAGQMVMVGDRCGAVAAGAVLGSGCGGRRRRRMGGRGGGALLAQQPERGAGGWCGRVGAQQPGPAAAGVLS